MGVIDGAKGGATIGNEGKAGLGIDVGNELGVGAAD